MGPTPEQQARAGIDRFLTAAGWSVQHMAQANNRAERGVALREFPLIAGFGMAALSRARIGGQLQIRGAEL